MARRSLSDIQQAERHKASVQFAQARGRARANVIGELAESHGVDRTVARRLVDNALRREDLEAYEPIARGKRMWAALDTLTNLMSYDWPTEDVDPGPTADVSIQQVEVDPEIQIRAGINPATVDEYRARMQEGDTFPPVVVFFDHEQSEADGELRLWLADGFHRIEAARDIADQLMIQARVVYGTREDAMVYAAVCNARHGLPLTRADKRAAVVRLLRFHPEWSDREIARRAGVSHSTVSSVRRELEASGQIDQIDERVVQRGEQEYTYTPPPAVASVTKLEEYVLAFLDHHGQLSASDQIALLAQLMRGTIDARELDIEEEYGTGDLRQAIRNVVQEIGRAYQEETAVEPGSTKAAERLRDFWRNHQECRLPHQDGAGWAFVSGVGGPCKGCGNSEGEYGAAYRYADRPDNKHQRSNLAWACWACWEAAALPSPDDVVSRAERKEERQARHDQAWEAFEASPAPAVGVDPGRGDEVAAQVVAGAVNGGDIEIEEVEHAPPPEPAGRVVTIERGDGESAQAWQLVLKALLRNDVEALVDVLTQAGDKAGMVLTMALTRVYGNYGAQRIAAAGEVLARAVVRSQVGEVL